MKTWNIPSVEELETRLTASSGVPGPVEAAGYLDGGNGWVNPTFDETIYENNGDCVIPKKESLS